MELVSRSQRCLGAAYGIRNTQHRPLSGFRHRGGSAGVVSTRRPGNTGAVEGAGDDGTRLPGKAANRPAAAGGARPTAAAAAGPERSWQQAATLEELSPNNPNAVTVAGVNLVVWRDPVAGEWVAMQDACPHQLARLSEGHITPHGELKCSKHGWAFHKGGACAAFCTSIPHIDDPKEHHLARSDPRNSVPRFPAQVSDGRLHIFPDASADGWLAAAAAAPAALGRAGASAARTLRLALGSLAIAAAAALGAGAAVLSTVGAQQPGLAVAGLSQAGAAAAAAAVAAGAAALVVALLVRPWDGAGAEESAAGGGAGRLVPSA